MPIARVLCTRSARVRLSVGRAMRAVRKRREERPWAFGVKRPPPPSFVFCFGCERRGLFRAVWRQSASAYAHNAAYAALAPSCALCGAMRHARGLARGPAGRRMRARSRRRRRVCGMHAARPRMRCRRTDVSGAFPCRRFDRACRLHAQGPASVWLPAGFAPESSGRFDKRRPGACGFIDVRMHGRDVFPGDD